jgi:hypothetical protein
LLTRAAALAAARLQWPAPSYHQLGELLAALTRLLHPACSLHTKPKVPPATLPSLPAGPAWPEPGSSLAAAEDGRWVRANRSEPWQAGLAAALNAFGARGGFDAVLAVLRLPAAPSYLLLARAALSFPVAVRELLAREWADPWIGAVRGVLFDQLLLLAVIEPLTRDERAAFKDLGALVQQLMSRSFPEEQIDEYRPRSCWLLTCPQVGGAVQLGDGPASAALRRPRAAPPRPQVHRQGTAVAVSRR